MARIWDGTKNGDYHADRTKYNAACLRAAGFDKKHSTDAQPVFNGGLWAPRESRQQVGDKIYRFNDSSVTGLAKQVKGEWWFDEDTCLTLMKICYGDLRKLRDTARSAFAVLDEWGDMCFLVTGTLKYDFWTIKGFTATAETALDKRVGHFGRDVMQIFIPGGFVVEDFSVVRPAAITRNVY